MLSNVTDNFVGDDFKNVEVHSLAKRSAFANDGNISFFDCEGWRTVHWDVSVSLFISVVFRNVVEVVSSDDDGPLHLGGDDNAFKDLSSDGNVAGEGTFLINVG